MPGTGGVLALPIKHRSSTLGQEARFSLLVSYLRTDNAPAPWLLALEDKALLDSEPEAKCERKPG